MTVDFVKLDVEEVRSSFYLQDGELYRKSSNARFDGMYVDDQKMVRVRDIRTTVNRVKYVLLHRVNPVGEVLMNDRGNLVDVDNNHLRMIIFKRDEDNVIKHNMGYLGRYVNRNGVRIGKKFSSYDEAKEYAKTMTRKVWKGVANEYGFRL